MIEKFKFTALSLFSVIALVSGAVPASAATTVTPQAAYDSSTNPIFSINMTSCLEVFNWRQYLDDVNAGIPSSNPYDKQGCVREKNLTANGTRTVTRNRNDVTAVRYNVGQRQINKQRYNQFTVGQPNTKQAFGNLPVIGIFPNGNQPAQALNSFDINGAATQSVPTFDRSLPANISSIYPAGKLNTLFPQGSARTGMPRIPNTGPATFDANGSWLGGFCTSQGGKIQLRNRIGPDARGNVFTIRDFTRATGTDISGKDPSDLPEICGWPNKAPYNTPSFDLYDEGIYKDQSLEAYQFIYKIPYPANQGECNSLFPNSFSNYNECIDWFRNRFSFTQTGSRTGNAIYYTYTFYGSWNGQYTEWVGWENPDINKARKNFVTSGSLDQLRAYYGDDLGTLRQLFNAPTATLSDLANRMDNASQAVKNQYRDLLKNKYEGYIRSLDGYSIYAF
jgi:hypothetical protein